MNPAPQRHGSSHKQRFLTLGLSLALSLAACGRLDNLRLRVLRAATLSPGESPVQLYKLDNGLTVLIKENHANPIVTLDVWVDTGSMNEPPHINGVSHFLEHMMFKGTEQRPVGVVDREIEGVGGETNAATSMDFTHYYVTVASDYISTGLDVLSDVMTNAALDPNELERERMVILEEWRRRQDSPSSFLYDEIYKLAYLTSPYKQSTLGTSESISSITRDQIIDYYNRYYTPNNMILIAAGDVQADTLKPLIERYFGPCRRTKQPFADLVTYTRRAAAGSRIIDKDLRDTYSIMAFPAPCMEDPRETVIMDVALVILGEGRSSRLYRSLREEKKLVSGVHAGYGTCKKPGLFVIFATLQAKNLDAMRDAALEEVQRLRRQLVGRSELAKARKMLTNSYYFSNETTNGQAFSLGFYYILSGSEKYEQRYLDEIARVTARDVRRVAQQYLDPEKIVMLTLRPKSGETRPSGGQ